MLVLKPNLEVWWPVRVEFPGDGGAEPQIAEFEMKFRTPKHSEFTQTAEDGKRGIRIEDYILDWRGIQDDTGAGLPFSPERLEALLDDPYILRGIDRAFGQVFSGEHVRKNSPRP